MMVAVLTETYMLSLWLHLLSLLFLSLLKQFLWT